MYGAFEDDLVRPLGFVTLYAAYAEGELDEFISALPSKEPYDDQKRQWTLGRKLSYARRLARKLRLSESSTVLPTLNEATALFAQRNELVHGRLFAGGRLVSNQAGKEEQRISEADIVRLAEDLFNWKERLWLCRCRELLPLLESLPKSNDA